MKYTLQYFKKLKACEPALDWFAKTFPNGATLTEIEEAISNKNWLGWLAVYMPDISLADRGRLAMKSNYPEYWLNEICEKLVEEVLNKLNKEE